MSPLETGPTTAAGTGFVDMRAHNTFDCWSRAPRWRLKPNDSNTMCTEIVGETPSRSVRSCFGHRPDLICARSLEGKMQDVTSRLYLCESGCVVGNSGVSTKSEKLSVRFWGWPLSQRYRVLVPMGSKSILRKTVNAKECGRAHRTNVMDETPSSGTALYYGDYSPCTIGQSAQASPVRLAQIMIYDDGHVRRRRVSGPGPRCEPEGLPGVSWFRKVDGQNAMCLAANVSQPSLKRVMLSGQNVGGWCRKSEPSALHAFVRHRAIDGLEVMARAYRSRPSSLQDAIPEYYCTHLSSV